MNKTRYWVSTLAVFAFIFGFEWLVHGVLMKDIYQATKELWRSEEAMNALFLLMPLAYFIIAATFCCMFVKGYENRGLMEGVRFGTYVGVLMAAPQLIMYVVAPYPYMMVAYWMLATLVMYIGSGVVAAALYRQ